MHVNQRVADIVRSRDKEKKILALDGGGICGVATVEILAELESMLRSKTGGSNQFVLADYFDFFVGTSTGAIIACCLAMGMSTERIRDFYVASGKEMFDRNSLLQRWRAKYDDDKLTAKLKQELGEDTLLGDDKIRTLLMMVMRNASTDSPWPVTNNPRAKYNDLSRDDCNLKLPVWQLVRASSAAPTYFPPETIRIGKQTFVFEDGGVTTFNNPAFLAFVVATTGPYNMNWETGEDRMLLVSVGTGNSPKIPDQINPSGRGLLSNAETVPGALMFAAQFGQDLFCRALGKCLNGSMLDREVNTLIGASGPTSPKLFTYLRYDFETTVKGLADLGISDVEPLDIQKLDSTDHIPDLQRVGAAVARAQVNADHFDGFL